MTAALVAVARFVVLAVAVVGTGLAAGAALAYLADTVWPRFAVAAVLSVFVIAVAATGRHEP